MDVICLLVGLVKNNDKNNRQTHLGVSVCIANSTFKFSDMSCDQTYQAHLPVGFLRRTWCDLNENLKVKWNSFYCNESDRQDNCEHCMHYVFCFNYLLTAVYFCTITRTGK